MAQNYDFRNKTLDQDKVALNRFNFHNGPRIFDIDISNFVLPLARAFEILTPIAPRSIKIRYGGDNPDLAKAGTLQSLAMTLQAGTKAFNAILLAAIVSSGRIEEFDHLFEFIPTHVVSLDIQNKMIGLLCASIVVLYTRGSLPGSNATSAGQRLPNFVTNMVHDLEIKTESDLRTNVMDFDPKHLNIRQFMQANCYSGWDNVIANRLNLGVAGHKPLKAIIDLNPSINQQHLQNNHLASRLRAAAEALNGGFYLSLHPAFASLSNHYQKFYLNCLHAIFSVMNGSNDEKYTLMRNLAYFRNERALTEKTIHMFPAGYANWNYGEWANHLGETRRFSDENRAEVRAEQMDLVIQEDWEIRANDQNNNGDIEIQDDDAQN